MRKRGGGGGDGGNIQTCPDVYSLCMNSMNEVKKRLNE